MSTKWNEKSQAEKAYFVVYCIFAIIAVVFAVLDLLNTWAYAHLGWCVSFAIMMFIDCKVNWEKKRTTAIIELICGIVLVAFNIVTLFV